MMKVTMIHIEQNLDRPTTVTIKHTDLKKVRERIVKSLKTRWKKYDNECSIYVYLYNSIFLFEVE
jgi:hypothetical protein